ncbi:hypothetical protein, partial [Enterococcus faecium]|uniref:hypothetical protein n=1 Tax=Enterococcus faecium TaxID=1352 RepID=UPI0009452A0C
LLQVKCESVAITPSYSDHRELDWQFNIMREPVYFKKWVIFWRGILLARARLFYLFFKDFLEPFLGGS